VIDVHTHLHPERLAHAIRRWFNEHSDWNVQHPYDKDAVVESLEKHGVERFVFCSYAHKPGIARGINDWLAKASREINRYGLPLSTVHLDDASCVDDAKKAIDDGCIGLKIHEDVQMLQIDDPRFEKVYEEIEKINGFVLAHMGPIPWRLEPEVAVQRVRRVLEKHPNLNLVLAHMGTPDTEAYMDLLDETTGLYLDTTMAFSNVNGLKTPLDVALIERHSKKILFGSDFPNIPYAYDFEPGVLKDLGLSSDALLSIFEINAKKLLAPFL
jgi:predicted TIM-barrel fold metal-dependent hydrolase